MSSCRVPIFLVFLLAVAAVAEEPHAATEVLPALPEETWGDWLLEVDLLISDREYEAFLELDTDAERDAFITHFWKLRDPRPRTVGNELRERHQRHVRWARERFGDLASDPAQVVVLHGLPALAYTLDCKILRPLLLFHYPRRASAVSRTGSRPAFSALFVQDPGADDAFRLWSPREGIPPLTKNRQQSWQSRYSVLNAAADEGCFAGREYLLGYLVKALGSGHDWGQLLYRAAIPEPERGWRRKIMKNLRGGDEVEGRLEVAFPTRAGNLTTERIGTVIHLELPCAALERRLGLKTGTPTAEDTARLLLRGELIPDFEAASEAAFVDRFRHRFELSPQLPGCTTLPLAVYRELVPGPYRLVLRLEDTRGTVVLRNARLLEVPATPDDPPDDAALSSAGELARLVRQPGISLHPVPGLVTGKVKVALATTGTGIAAVRFELDGNDAGRAVEAPFDTVLDFGDRLRGHTLRAVATGAPQADTGGAELARDEIRVNAGAQRFAVRLAEPVAGERWALVRAAVEVPAGHNPVERLEIYLGDEWAATLFQPPFVHPLRLSARGEATEIRALAVRDDGSSAESSALIGSEAPQADDAATIEVFAEVQDSRGRRLEGLGRDDFRILEDGAEREVVDFERVRTLPIHLVLLVDNSASMVGETDSCKSPPCGRPFRWTLENNLRFLTAPGLDVGVAVMTFNDRVRSVAPFTGDFDLLTAGVSSLGTWGGTALYDGVVHALHSCGGLEGRCAVVLLTGSRDDSSRFTAADALAFARRSGVAVYPVLWQQDSQPSENPSPAEVMASVSLQEFLHQLAVGTGGKVLTIRSTKELRSAFTQIRRQLVVQYRIVYRSGTAAGEPRFLTIETSRPGLTARILGGVNP